MSNQMHCFDTVKEMIDEVSKRFVLYKVDDEKLHMLQSYCVAVDKLIDVIDGDALQVSVNENSMEILIQVECDSMEVEHQTHIYYALAKRSMPFTFEATKEGKLLIGFTFPSVWSKKA